MPWDRHLSGHLGTGFVAFSALASAFYVANDLADRNHDQAHPTKRLRPIASGAVGTGTAIAVAAALFAVSVLAALTLPRAFAFALAAYGLSSAAYSAGLKRRPVLDVIVLATLYTTRIVAGAALVAVPLSRWFLAFAVFLFFSLSLVKRVAELLDLPLDTPGFVRGRSYVRADAPTLVALGAACTAASALVYCLYITSADASLLYTRADLLWPGLPLLIYWQARIWLIAGRGDMHQDPVVFALRDRVSYVVLAAFAVILVAAA